MEVISLHIRYVLTPLTERSYPVFIEAVGMNGKQEELVRDAGYPYFHWIQTQSGVGEMYADGRTFLMPPGTGALMLPNSPHRYRQVSAETWSTWYLTFGGALAHEIVQMLGLGHRATLFTWEAGAPGTLHDSVEAIMNRLETDERYTPLQGSQDVYRFLAQLSMYVQVNSRSSLSEAQGLLEPLVQLLEERYAETQLGLSDMAAVLGVSSRHVNTLFRSAFGLSPYAYLILLRIRKAKSLLLDHPELPVTQVAERVGFRDASHFIASFRKHVGLTPERFRNYR